MPFSPEILRQVAESIDPECFALPEPGGAMNAYDKLANMHFMNEAGAIVTFPRPNHRFTLNFGFDGCTVYCKDTSPALATMDKDWRHIVINSMPEMQGRFKEFRQDFRKHIETNPLADPKIPDKMHQVYNVPNVTVLFPVVEVDDKWIAANNKARYPQKTIFVDKATGKKWALSNQAAADAQTALGLITNPSNPRAHNPNILTFDAQGCQTGKFDASEIENKTFKLKQGCSR
jgi:hypothetical protein